MVEGEENQSHEEKWKEFGMFNLKKTEEGHDCTLQLPQGMSHRGGQGIVLHCFRAQGQIQ